MWSNYSTRRNISDETIVRKSGGVGGVIEGRIGHIKMSSLLSDDVLWLFRVFGVWLGFIGLFFDDIYRWLMMYSTFHFFFLISDTFFRIFFFFHQVNEVLWFPPDHFVKETTENVPDDMEIYTSYVLCEWQ